MFKRKREGDIVQRHSEVARAECLMYSPCIKYGRAATDGHCPLWPAGRHINIGRVASTYIEHVLHLPPVLKFALLAVF